MPFSSKVVFLSLLDLRETTDLWHLLNLGALILTYRVVFYPRYQLFALQRLDVGVFEPGLKIGDLIVEAHDDQILLLYYLHLEAVA